MNGMIILTKSMRKWKSYLHNGD